MIRVYAKLLECDAVPLFDFFTCLVEGLRAVRTSKDCFAVFDWRYEMVVDLVSVMFAGPDRAHTLML